MRTSFFSALAALATLMTAPTNAFLPSSPLLKSNAVNQKVTTTVHLPFKEAAFPTSVSPAGTSKTVLSLSGSDIGTGDGSLTQYMTKLLLETLIVNGVPTVFTILVIGFIAVQFRSRKDKDDDEDFDVRGFDSKQKKNPAAELYSDLYEGDQTDKPMSPFAFFKMFKPPQTPASTNRGIPALQYVKVTNLNQKYDSYDYSLTSATESKAKAAAAYRTKNFERALRLGLNGGGADAELSPFAKTTLLELEKKFLQDGSKLLDIIQTAQAELTKVAINEEMEALGMEPFQLDPPNNLTSTLNETKELRPKTVGKTKENKKSQSGQSGTTMKLLTAQTDLTKLELNFVKDVVKTLGSERATGIRTALVGDIAARGTGGLLTQLQDRPLSALLNGKTIHKANGEDDAAPSKGEVANTGERRKSVFVTRFPGDPVASQVVELREEVTAIVRNAKPGDEALVILQTGGGTVTGYGLAAAQLLRFKDAGMKLTIAVEQVAASGGYMMCCVADKIVSSPFAVLGSIGVITDIPNVYERLKREGIEFQTVTAGKYKRQLNPTKKITPQDVAKTKEDVEQILVLFKQFVSQNRPSLDIDAVATGETWFGEDALQRGLTDEIKTADEVLMEYVDSGWDVYEVEYSPPDKQALTLSGAPGRGSDDNAGVIRNAIRWLVRTFVREMKSELGNDLDRKEQTAPERRYMMLDDSSERVRSEYK